MTEDTFLILPAIDLRGGKVVRLAQGDPSRQTTYADHPLAWAERWKSEGASWLHVVNLDGAFGEDPGPNMAELKRILTLGMKVEFGGGVRDRSTIDGLFELGVERVCLGTAAIREPALLEWALQSYSPAHISADIGVRDGKVLVKGWQEPSPLTVQEAGKKFRTQGLEWCVLTNVQRDGIGQGIDLSAAFELQDSTGLRVVASGGVCRVEEVQAAREGGLAGIILGRALYEGTLVLSDCLAVLEL
jgi:phosphoribosylformimino-5-aminoimidazole carboxamide ribotide isomerase